MTRGAHFDNRPKTIPDAMRDYGRYCRSSVGRARPIKVILGLAGESVDERLELRVNLGLFSFSMSGYRKEYPPERPVRLKKVDDLVRTRFPHHGSNPGGPSRINSKSSRALAGVSWPKSRKNGSPAGWCLRNIEHNIMKRNENVPFDTRSKGSSP